MSAYGALRGGPGLRRVSRQACDVPEDVRLAGRGDRRRQEAHEDLVVAVREPGVALELPVAPILRVFCDAWGFGERNLNRRSGCIPRLAQPSSYAMSGFGRPTPRG